MFVLRSVSDLYRKFHTLHQMISKIYSAGDKPEAQSSKTQSATQKKSATRGRKKKDAPATTQRVEKADAITATAISATAKPTQKGGRSGKTQVTKKPAPVKFTYIYRLSYTSTLGLLAISFGY